MNDYTLLIVPIVAALPIIDLIFYLSWCPYPHRYGILIKKMPIPRKILLSDWDWPGKISNSLAAKVNYKRNEVFIRFRMGYPLVFGLSIATGLFIGRIKYGTSDVLEIRVGYLISLFYAVLFIYGIIRVINLSIAEIVELGMAEFVVFIIFYLALIYLIINQYRSFNKVINEIIAEKEKIDIERHEKKEIKGSIFSSAKRVQ